jgi:hypothetical protein
MKASVFALAVLWTGALFAQAPAPPEHAAHMDRLATLLDLTDAQKTQVQAILQEEHAKMHASFEQAKASGTKPDWQQMQALHQQVRQETLQKLAPVLSEAQLKKFQTLQEMHGEMMHGHFGHGPPPGGATPPALQN